MAEKLIIEVDLEDGNSKTFFNNLEKSAEKSGKEAGSDFSKGFSNILSTAGGFLAAKALTSGLAAIRGEIGKLVGTAQRLEVIETQFKTILGSTAAAQKQLEELQKFSANTPFKLEGLANATRQLLSFGVASKDIIPILTQLGDVASGAGAKLNELTIPFGRLVSTQKLTLIELDKFADRGINLYAEFAKQTGKSIGEIRNAVSKGQIPFEEFTKALKNLTSEGGKFFKSTEAQSKTLAGSLSTLSDNLDILRNNFAKAFSPALKAIVVTLTQSVQSLSASFQGFNVTPLIESLIVLGNIINNLVIAPLELLFNVGKLVFNTILLGVQGVIAAFAELGEIAGAIAGAFGFDQVQTNLQNFKESSAAVLEEFSTNAKDSLNGIFDGTVFSSNEEFLNNLKTNLEQASTLIDESGIADKLKLKTNTDGEDSGPLDFVGNVNAIFSGVNAQLTNTGKNFSVFKDNIKNATKQISSTLIAGFGNAFRAVGKALATGENAFDAFGKAILGSLGEVASQIGDFFIKQGIGYFAMPGGQGTGAALIAAGVGMKVLSGVLGGVSSGSGSSTPAGTATDPVFSTSPEETFASDEENIQTPNSIQITVQGDIFDSDQTGNRIVDIINKNFETTGSNLNQVSFT